MRERVLSCGFIRGSADREGGRHSLSTPPRPPLQVLSFTSRLKPENKERGRVKAPKKTEAKSAGGGARRPPSSSSGPAACAGLVEEASHGGEGTRGANPSTCRA